MNDTFAPVGTGLSNYELLIYDRWGNLIFSGGPLNPWTGKTKGSKEVVPGGVYLYKIDLRDDRLSKQDFTGRVTLIR